MRLNHVYLSTPVETVYVAVLCGSQASQEQSPIARKAVTTENMKSQVIAKSRQAREEKLVKLGGEPTKHKWAKTKTRQNGPANAADVQRTGVSLALFVSSRFAVCVFLCHFVYFKETSKPTQ